MGGSSVGTASTCVLETRLLSERNFSNAAISSSGMNEFISGVERVARNTIINHQWKKIKHSTKGTRIVYVSYSTTYLVLGTFSVPRINPVVFSESRRLSGLPDRALVE